METVAIPTRAVLSGVPRGYFYEGGPRCPEDLPFPSVMRALLESLGENLGCKHMRPLEASWGLGCAYSFFTGVSGMGFALNWADAWGGETYALLSYLPGGPSEPYRRAFESVGYGMEYMGAEAGEAALREKIRASIFEKERPVIALGVIGPPEPCLVTGYDEDGQVLLGWNFFQVMEQAETEPAPEGEPYGYFRKRGWFPSTPGLVLVGEKGPRPAQDEVFAKALRWGVDILRGSNSAGANTARVRTGLHAFTAWAEHLLRDGDFPAGDEAILRQRYDTHNFQVGQIAEARWYTSQWILNTFEKLHFRAHEPLLHAAACFAGEHELMWKAWDLVGGINNAEAWRELAKPEVRQKVAEVVLASRAKDAQAADYIESALYKL